MKTNGVAAFAYGQAWTLYLVLFFMGMQSAFFGPSKLGIVPELVGNTRLSRANGYLNAVTYIAIISILLAYRLKKIFWKTKTKFSRHTMPEEAKPF